MKINDPREKCIHQLTEIIGKFDLNAVVLLGGKNCMSAVILRDSEPVELTGENKMKVRAYLDKAVRQAALGNLIVELQTFSKVLRNEADTFDKMVPMLKYLHDLD